VAIKTKRLLPLHHHRHAILNAVVMVIRLNLQNSKILTVILLLLNSKIRMEHLHQHNLITVTLLHQHNPTVMLLHHNQVAMVLLLLNLNSK
jgi:hypothetical protein